MEIYDSACIEVFGFKICQVQNLYQKNERHSKLKLGTKFLSPVMFLNYFIFWNMKIFSFSLF